MRHRHRRGFTLAEIVAVMVVLAVLVGVALPRYYDYAMQADLAVTKGIIGAVETGLGSARLAYVTGDTIGLPPDSNGNGAPDHLGDTTSGEPTLFDAVLDPPLVPQARGWKQFPGVPVPWLGRYYLYIYDTNGNNTLDFPDEGYFYYDAQTGTVTTHAP
jgi:prepilin-type N-terminal cleavage/methylation domain-containing protein